MAFSAVPMLVAASAESRAPDSLPTPIGEHAKIASQRKPKCRGRLLPTPVLEGDAVMRPHGPG